MSNGAKQVYEACDEMLARLIREAERARAEHTEKFEGNENNWALVGDKQAALNHARELVRMLGGNVVA